MGSRKETKAQTADSIRSYWSTGSWRLLESPFSLVSCTDTGLVPQPEQPEVRLLVWVWRASFREVIQLACVVQSKENSSYIKLLATRSVDYLVTGSWFLERSNAVEVFKCMLWALWRPNTECHQVRLYSVQFLLSILDIRVNCFFKLTYTLRLPCGPSHHISSHLQLDLLDFDFSRIYTILARCI